MNAKDVAHLILDALGAETTLAVDVADKPRPTADYHCLNAEDENGNTFVIKVIQMNAEDADDEVNDCLHTDDLEDVDL